MRRLEPAITRLLVQSPYHCTNDSTDKSSPNSVLNKLGWKPLHVIFTEIVKSRHTIVCQLHVGRVLIEFQYYLNLADLGRLTFQNRPFYEANDNFWKILGSHWKDLGPNHMDFLVLWGLDNKLKTKNGEVVIRSKFDFIKILNQFASLCSLKNDCKIGMYMYSSSM